MGNLSFFMKGLKQRFTQWFNGTRRRTGTLWESRFHSVVVEDAVATLRVMGAYIDLNPIRARIVADPADYGWSGYAAAMKGDDQALAGLARILGMDGDAGKQMAERQGKQWDICVLENYRMWLYTEGQDRPGDAQGQGAKAGFSKEESLKMKQKGGALPIGQVLRRRVRYMTRGLIVGSKEFVNGWFAENRGFFGPKRKTAARPMKGGDFGGLCAGRALGKAIGPDNG
jgi:putative transposase